jgi:hypothetical protein
MLTMVQIYKTLGPQVQYISDRVKGRAVCIFVHNSELNQTMKYILFILLFTLIFCIDSKSQTNQFNGRVNTIIITDSLITINNLQQLLLKNGYLFTYKSESILVTDYKTTINVHDIV